MTAVSLSAIARALPYAGTHTLDDIEVGVAEGRFQFWGNPECGIVTEILKTPLRKTCLFFLAAGHLEGLRAMTPAILSWAREQGCTHAAFIGRFGWERSFVQEFGFKPVSTMMETEL